MVTLEAKDSYVFRNAVVSVLVGLLLSLLPTTAHAQAPRPQSPPTITGVHVPGLNVPGPAQPSPGTPIALLFISAALLFLPTILG